MIEKGSRGKQKKRWEDRTGDRTELLAQLGQLKRDQVERDCCKVIFGAQTTLQGYGIYHWASLADIFVSFLHCIKYIAINFLTDIKTGYTEKIKRLDSPEMSDSSSIFASRRW